MLCQAAEALMEEVKVQQLSLNDSHRREVERLQSAHAEVIESVLVLACPCWMLKRYERVRRKSMRLNGGYSRRKTTTKMPKPNFKAVYGRIWRQTISYCRTSTRCKFNTYFSVHFCMGCGCFRFQGHSLMSCFVTGDAQQPRTSAEARAS